jgi:hypothetical protein
MKKFVKEYAKEMWNIIPVAGFIFSLVIYGFIGIIAYAAVTMAIFYHNEFKPKVRYDRKEMRYKRRMQNI